MASVVQRRAIPSFTLKMLPYFTAKRLFCWSPGDIILVDCGQVFQELPAGFKVGCMATGKRNNCESGI